MRKKKKVAYNETLNTHRNVLAGNMDIHTPKASDQVHGDKDRTQSGQLRQNVVDLVVCVCHLYRDLGQVVGVRTRKNLLIVVQALGHRD